MLSFCVIPFLSCNEHTLSWTHGGRHRCEETTFPTTLWGCKPENVFICTNIDYLFLKNKIKWPCFNHKTLGHSSGIYLEYHWSKLWVSLDVRGFDVFTNSLNPVPFSMSISTGHSSLFFSSFTSLLVLSGLKTWVTLGYGSVFHKCTLFLTGKQWNHTESNGLLVLCFIFFRLYVQHGSSK